MHYGLEQLNACEILDALKPLKKKDTYCVLGVTNRDLYPDDSYNFVFGIARLGEGTGVFSFCRYAPDFNNAGHGEYES